MNVKENLNKKDWIMDLEIEIDENDVKKEMEKKILDIRNNVNVPGFRKGKVPESLVRMKYKDLIQDELTADVRRNNLAKYFEENKHIIPINIDEALDKAETDIDTEKGGTIKVSVVIYPIVEVKKEDYTDLEVKYKKIELTEEAVEKKLKEMSEKYASYNDIETEIPDKPTILIYADTSVKVEEKEIEKFSQKNLMIFLDSKSIPGLKENVIGKKVKDEINYKVKITKEDGDDLEDYYDKEADVSLKINQVKEKIVPEIDDELAIKSGHESIDIMKKEYTEGLEKEFELKNEEEKEKQIFTEILKKIEFDVPEILIKREAKTRLNSFGRMFQGKVKEADILKYMGFESLDEYSEKSRDNIIFDIKQQIVLKAIVDAEKIEPEKEVIDAELEKDSKQQNMDKKEFRRWLINNGYFENWKNRLKEKEVIDKLKKENKIIEE